MTVRVKIKTTNSKFEQNIVQHDLGRQAAKILALSSGNVAMYEFSTGEEVLPEKGLSEKELLQLKDLNIRHK